MASGRYLRNRSSLAMAALTLHGDGRHQLIMLLIRNGASNIEFLFGKMYISIINAFILSISIYIYIFFFRKIVKSEIMTISSFIYYFVSCWYHLKLMCMYITNMFQLKVHQLFALLHGKNHSRIKYFVTFKQLKLHTIRIIFV